MNESLKEVGLSKVKNKKHALDIIVTSYPGKHNNDANAWIYYNDCIVELVAAFKITKAELQAAMKEAKDLDDQMRTKGYSGF